MAIEPGDTGRAALAGGGATLLRLCRSLPDSRVCRQLTGIVLVRCTLCWRITAAIFLSIIVIEGMILLPSLANHRDEYLQGRADAAAAAVEAATAAMAQAAGPGQRPDLALLVGIAGIAGLAVLDREGSVLDIAGDLPDDWLSATHGVPDLGMRRTGKTGLLLAARADPATGERVFLHVAASELRQASLDYLLRILGLVALIAAVVTVATMLVLQYVLLSRILRLDEALAAAAAEPERADERILGTGADDELGSLVRNADRLFVACSQSLAALRCREQEISAINGTLERRVLERTHEMDRARQRAERASQAKSDFLAHMSHELRTPLNAILGFAEIMHAEALGPMSNPRYREYSGDILRSGERLAEIVDDVLDLVEVDGESVMLDRAAVDLADLLRETALTLMPVAQARRVHLDLPPGSDLILVHVDRGRIRRAMLNMVENAIIHSGPAGWVSVGFARREDGAVAVVVDERGSVAAGRSPAWPLEPFLALGDPEVRDGRRGIGFGLPLTARILELHGGEMEVRGGPEIDLRIAAWLPAACLIKWIGPEASGAVAGTSAAEEGCA